MDPGQAKKPKYAFVAANEASGLVRFVAQEIGSDGNRSSISFGQSLALIRDDEEYRDQMIQLLRRGLGNGEAFFFEAPGVSAETFTSRPFEFVLLAAPQLDGVDADPGPFAAHFAPGALVATFPSLGGDAALVAPCPLEGSESVDYAHLAAFVRSAGREQAHALLRA
eukprot:CAMPEP_0113684288 /NCGR_PEP_ID=MMETSP0038_2-20120614/13905_1 /TAXON_ID=2898 /ORGANISM="Cryptomonas paramecium" /LENGTH=166 /DNA_ID=CAMNT_0000603991 /DNA_START=122 /DNA_END=619 /DNA_ORIENTATION=+ /assembly_acc=CAM_ASM_000170